MNTAIFEAFDSREKHVTEYMAGCGMKFGMACTCGPDCRCTNCPIHANGEEDDGLMNDDSIMPSPLEAYDGPLQIDQQMDFTFGMEPPAVPGPPTPVVQAPSFRQTSGPPTSVSVSFAPGLHLDARAQRNPSILSYGNGLRNMSLTSDATFGRAMSGLSALSIDWENLEDFDLEVDHSAHINNSPSRNNDRRRSSLRRSIMSTGEKEVAI